jgi:RNA polymerase sigma-70 factor (ECF subfamily)
VAACVERVRRQRDEDAARALMQHLSPLVLKLVRAHLPRRTSEEDLVQVVFMKIFANLDQYSGAVALEHWASRIAINTCLNQLKAERARPEWRLADLSEEQSQVIENLKAAPGELDPSQSVAARDLVETLLARLDPTDRVLMTLLHLEERPVREVARLTGWGQTRVRVRAFRARQKLKKHLRLLMLPVKP